ncbi:MAG TPA: DUF6249 domain-containing protein [Candidatus Didemnitutus sp.]|nr:DUF6249 domain-containing protein [Candidatus Didemnitutus sp.]
MHSLFSALPSPVLGAFFADIANIPWVAIVAVGGGILVALVVGTTAIVFGIKHSQRQQELWHETARIALEKGQPLPPMPDGMKAETKPEARSNDFRSGLILIGVGGGLYFFFEAMNLPFLRFVGAIPGFIGVALLLFALGGLAFGGKDDSTPRS